MFDKLDLMEKFENYSEEELNDVKTLIDNELRERSSQRFSYLVSQILTAVHCLEREFSNSEILIDFNGESINLLDYTWDESRFSR